MKNSTCLSINTPRLAEMAYIKDGFSYLFPFYCLAKRKKSTGESIAQDEGRVYQCHGLFTGPY